MSLSLFSDEYFMNEAFKEAQLAFNEDEIPIGAVVVWNNRIIARAHNQTERLNDPTAHAEMLAITAATEAVGGKYLSQCSIFVTLEPCLMCAGALQWVQIGKIIFAASDPRMGFIQAFKPLPYASNTSSDQDKTFTNNSSNQKKKSAKKHEEAPNLSSAFSPDTSFIPSCALHPKTKVLSGIRAEESLALIKDFFAKKRNR